MVAGRGEGVRQSGEDAAAVMADLAHLAVHRHGGADHLAAEGLADRLMTEADAEQRDRAGAAHEIEADAGMVGIARARRDDDALRLQRQRRLDGEGVVPLHQHLGAELAQIVPEVVSEAVVIIDQQEHRGVISGSRAGAKARGGGGWGGGGFLARPVFGSVFASVFGWLCPCLRPPPHPPAASRRVPPSPPRGAERVGVSDCLACQAGYARRLRTSRAFALSLTNSLWARAIRMTFLGLPAAVSRLWKAAKSGSCRRTISATTKRIERRPARPPRTGRLPLLLP